MYFGTFPSGFYKTTDGGMTWYEANKNFTIDGAFSMVFHPYNKNIIYAGTYNGVSLSQDAGNSWEKIDAGIPPEQWVFSIVIDPSDPDIIYIASKNGEDKGRGREGFHGVVMKSTDGGDTWFEIMNGLEYDREYYQLIMYPYNYEVLFVSTNYGIFMTENGGESWTPINDGLDVYEEIIRSGIVNNVANNLQIDSEGKYLYLGTMGRGVYTADLEKLNLQKDPDIIPLHCFNYIKDGDETGIDCGGSCFIDCEDYLQGIKKETEKAAFEEELIDASEEATSGEKLVKSTSFFETQWSIYILIAAGIVICASIVIPVIYFKKRKKTES
jgi:hypothetical protein